MLEFVLTFSNLSSVLDRGAIADHLHGLKSLSSLRYFGLPVSWLELFSWSPLLLTLCGVSIWLTGQSDSSFWRKSGPIHHFFSLAKSDTLMPLVVKSGGFPSVGTKRHCLGFVRLWISPTRFATKGLNIRLLPLIHQRTFILSDQKTAWPSPPL